MARDSDLGWLRRDNQDGEWVYFKHYVVPGLDVAQQFTAAAMDILERVSGEPTEAMFTLDRSGLGISVFSSVSENPQFTDEIDRMVEAQSPAQSESEYPGQLARQVADDSYWRQVAIQKTYDAVGDWKLAHLESDREVLAKVFLAADLRHSVKMASTVAHLAIEKDFDENILITADPNKMLVILNMYGEGALPDSCRELGKYINKVL